MSEPEPEAAPEQITLDAATMRRIQRAHDKQQLGWREQATIRLGRVAVSGDGHSAYVSRNGQTLRRVVEFQGKYVTDRKLARPEHPGRQRRAARRAAKEAQQKVEE